MRIGVSMFIFLLWAPALLQDPASSLDPNSFVHISIFVHLREAFLGIEPHFELFHFLFHLKLQPNRFVLDVVGTRVSNLGKGRIECISLITLVIK